MSTSTTTTTTTGPSSSSLYDPHPSSSSVLDDSVPADDDSAELSNSPSQLPRIPSLSKHRANPSTTSSISSSSAAPNPLLRGLSLKAVQSTLSKSLSVALQYTREKIGRADATTEEEPFLSTVAAVHTIQAQLKAVDKSLAALLTAQQTSILSHDGLSAALKRIHSRDLGAATPRNAVKRDSVSAPSAADPIASIEAATAAFAGSAKPDEEPPVEAPTGDTADAKDADEKAEAGDAAFHPGAPPPLSTAPTFSLLPQFYPYSRRLLAGRLTASDAYGALLASVRQLQATALKAALAAISQLEIDRLHYDACQTNLRTLTAADSTAVAPATTPLEADAFQLKVDAAQLVYLRSKQATEERAFELVARVKEEMERALTAIVAVERFEVEAGAELLKGQAEGRELEGRKKTNPWTTKRAAGAVGGAEEEEENAGLRREVDALR